jgi:hypothetical protein
VAKQIRMKQAMYAVAGFIPATTISVSSGSKTLNLGSKRFARF